MEIQNSFCKSFNHLIFLDWRYHTFPENSFVDKADAEKDPVIKTGLVGQCSKLNDSKFDEAFKKKENVAWKFFEAIPNGTMLCSLWHDAYTAEVSLTSFPSPRRFRSLQISF